MPLLSTGPDTSNPAAMPDAKHLLRPSAADIFDLALAAHQARDTARAEALYKRLLAVEPRHARGMANLAGLLLSRGETDMGLFLARRAVELAPADAEVRAVLARAYARGGDVRAATGQYRLALAGPGLSRAALRALGRGMAKIQDHQGARQALERALKETPQAGPEQAEIRCELASVLFRMGDLAAAEDHYLWRLEHAPASAPVLLDMGHIRMMAGDFASARDLLERALALGDSHTARFRLASLAFREDRLDEAAQQLEAACALDPDQANSRRFLGYVRRLLAGEAEARVGLGQITARFGLTGRNLAVEIAQANGEFYEARELAYLRAVLPPAAGRGPLTVLDVGANAGNHAVFFALGLGAARVIPFEFHPLMMRELAANAQRNNVQDRLDLSRLGLVVGAGPGRARLEEHPGRDLCLTEPVPDPAGDLEVAALDALDLPRAGLVKVDIQGGETAFLDGARQYLAAHGPELFMEVNETSEAPFLKRVQGLGYAVRHVFREPGYANVHLGPAAGTRP